MKIVLCGLLIFVLFSCESHKPRFLTLNQKLDRCITRYIRELNRTSKDALNLCITIYKQTQE